MTSRTSRSACFTSWSGDVSDVAGVLAGVEIDVSGVAVGVSHVAVVVAGVEIDVSCVAFVASCVVVSVLAIAVDDSSRSSLRASRSTSRASRFFCCLWRGGNPTDVHIPT